MIILYTLATLATLNTMLAFLGGAPATYAVASIGVAVGALVTLQVLPGPTKGWRSPSGAISVAPQPMPTWAVLVAAATLFGGLAVELWILTIVWGA